MSTRVARRLRTISALSLVLVALTSTFLLPGSPARAAVMRAAGCNTVQGAARFSQNGQRADSSRPIYRAWLAQWCAGHNLGPATSPEYTAGAGVTAQDFRLTAHRIVWIHTSGATAVQMEWGWAAQVFAARGIQPEWGTPVTHAWFLQFFAGNNWGPALDPVHRSRKLCGRQQQVFGYGMATYKAATVSWARQTTGEGLYRADRWKPIGDLVAAFGQAVVAHNQAIAARYLTDGLHQRETSSGVLKMLAIPAWPAQFGYIIHTWNNLNATVAVTFTVGSGKVTDTLDLAHTRQWQLAGIKRGQPAQPSCPATKVSSASNAVQPGSNALTGTYAIGDSVMLDAAPQLSRFGITVDAVVGRQFYQGLDILRSLQAENRLPGRVVIGLGTNGPMTDAEMAAMMSVLRGERRVVFVTVKEPRFWEGQVNAVVRNAAAHYSNVRVADWYAISAGHPEWFASDGIHVGPAGGDAYARAVASALSQS